MILLYFILFCMVCTGVVRAVVQVNMLKGDELPCVVNSPKQVWKDDNQNLFITDYDNNQQVMMISINEDIKILAGASQSNQTTTLAFDPSLFSSTHLQGPYGITGDNKGSLYVSEYKGNRVRKLSMTGGLTLIVGSFLVDNCGSTSDEEMPGIISLLCGPRGLFLMGSFCILRIL